jgi:signal transduction histidine kinase
MDLSRIVVDEAELRVALAKALKETAGSRQERAEQSSFISTISHELRTPLTAIHGSLRLIEAGVLGPLSDKLKETVAIASRNSNTLIGLINDILDFHKLEAGKMEFTFAPVSADALVREVCENLQGFAAKKNVTLRVTQTCETVFLADKARMIQVLANFLSNAVKFSPDNGEVIVSAACDGQTVRLSVADRGPGIPEELRERLFERYAQAKGQTTGTGLGLAISKIIAEAHQGRVRFDSSPAGTTFHVEVPAQRSLA